MNRNILFSVAAFLCGCFRLAGGEIQVTSSCPSGVTVPGDAVQFTVRYRGTPARERAIRVRIFRNGLEVRQKEHPLEQAITEKISCGTPGWFAVTAELVDQNGHPVGKKQLDPQAGCGVLVSPETIRRSRPRPAGRYRAILFDVCMSVVASGKIQLAADNGKPIPPGWILDKNGKPTTDPKEIYNGAIMLPFAQHKGYGFAVMVELLSGVLAGRGYWTVFTRGIWFPARMPIPATALWRSIRNFSAVWKPSSNAPRR